MFFCLFRDTEEIYPETIQMIPIFLISTPIISVIVIRKRAEKGYKMNIKDFKKGQNAYVFTGRRLLFKEENVLNYYFEKMDKWT